MALVELKISTPKHDAPFLGGTGIEFMGEVKLSDFPADVPLYYRWYSSLNPDVTKGRYSINKDALRHVDLAVPLTRTMPLGSQVISFAVSDQSGEADGDFNAMKYGAVTGGEGGESCCVIHVFQATIMAPADKSTLSPTGLVLKAAAPWAWTLKDYQRINHLAYRWSVKPKSAAAGLPTFVSSHRINAKLKFDGSDSSVAYEPGLDASTFKGMYEITLELLDISKPQIVRDQSSISVTFI